MVDSTTVANIRIMKFYNREEEVAELQRIEKLAFTSNSRMTVITGRRRIGKTSLIKRAFESSEAPMLYFFVARKTESALTEDFASEMRKKLDIYVPEGINTIIGLLRYLFETNKERRLTVVIDEFQEFQSINPSIFSDMQNLWDSCKNDTRLNLVLSGSVLSMMKKIFADAHEPLFGRADNIINLKPFKTSVIKEILHDYNPDFNSEDLLALYSITGGVPKYIELLCGNGHVTATSMLKFVTSYMSPFIDEGRNLLITEFGRDYGTYFSILLAISKGLTTQAEITRAVGNGSIGGHIERLESTYNIISKSRPIFSKPGSKNTVRFRISDMFLQFWFRFIESNRPMIELDNYRDLTELVKAQYPTYSGFTLERYFRQKLAEEGGFREIGSWWMPKAGQGANEIDIVGIRTDNRNALVAEVKRQHRNYEHKKFMEKVEQIQKAVLSRYEIETRLFTMDDM